MHVLRKTDLPVGKVGGADYNSRVSAEHDEPNWLTAEEQHAWRTYMDGNYRLMDVLNRDLQEAHGLTLAEYRILVLLSEAPDGRLRMSDLADGVLSSRSRLTHQIRRMEDEGLVLRCACAEDGRGVLAALTDEGRARLTEAAPTHVASVRRNLIDLLSKSQIKTLAQIFTKVAAAVGDR